MKLKMVENVLNISLDGRSTVHFKQCKSEDIKAKVLEVEVNV